MAETPPPTPHNKRQINRRKRNTLISFMLPVHMGDTQENETVSFHKSVIIVYSMYWRRKWQPTPVLLPEKSHGQRSLVSYSPWDHKKSDPVWMYPIRFVYYIFVYHIIPMPHLDHTRLMVTKHKPERKEKHKGISTNVCIHIPEG